MSEKDLTINHGIHQEIKQTDHELEEKYKRKYNTSPPQTQKELDQLGQEIEINQQPREILNEVSEFYSDLLDSDTPKNVKINTKRKPYPEIATGALTTALLLQVTTPEPALFLGTAAAVAAHTTYKNDKRNPNYNPITKNFSIENNEDAKTYENVAAEHYHAFQQFNNSPTFGDPILQEGTEMLARKKALENKAVQNQEFEEYTDAVEKSIYSSASKAIEKIENAETPLKQAVTYHLPAAIIQEEKTELQDVFKKGRTPLKTELEPYEQHLGNFWHFKMDEIYSRL